MDSFARFVTAREKKRNERWNIRKACGLTASGLSPEIMRAIEKRNITVSTPVQAGCIPPMMDWQDVIAKAPTGTGKTFAYGIPIVEHVDPEDESVQAVILAPTRELAIQITDEIRDRRPSSPVCAACAFTAGSPSAGRSTP